MKTLVLCRHAKSDWPEGIRDFDRPLKNRGEKDAARLGKLLYSHGFMPDLMVSSPANRAISTASIVQAELQFTQQIIQHASIYHEGTGSLLNLIDQLPLESDTVMIFGHNPTMEDTVRSLLRMNSPFQMPTAGMVCLESYSPDWQQFRKHFLHLRWMQIPRLQRKN
ncbi:MAG: histidine phosphatase family protein [Bacteroidota bacterium]